MATTAFTLQTVILDANSEQSDLGIRLATADEGYTVELQPDIQSPLTNSDGVTLTANGIAA